MSDVRRRTARPQNVPPIRSASRTSKRAPGRFYPGRQDRPGRPRSRCGAGVGPLILDGLIDHLLCQLPCRVGISVAGTTRESVPRLKSVWDIPSGMKVEWVVDRRSASVYESALGYGMERLVAAPLPDAELHVRKGAIELVGNATWHA